MQFEIPVVDERGKRTYIITLHLIVCFLLIVTGIFELLLHLFFIKGAKGALQHFTILRAGGICTTLAGLLLLGILLFKNRWLTVVKINRIIRFIELVLFLLFGAVAFKFNFTYPAIIFSIVSAALVYALFWENSSGEKKVIANDSGISVPKVNAGVLKWYEVQNVVLRFGIITIDCVDNRLFQWDIRKVDFDEDMFLDFCNAQIAANIKNRGKNW